ncbi:MarR family transcriptional regulator [Rhodospirillum rubrum]|uniref:MarR family winged helix-turn-helix transcriptional regulator n=1 Tax=Rhodospirillum rubrum TaxID=1085 RepID=UPI0019031916|nr:MarR family transcriptional regulator [Rhodospirillum rubrum]MBK1665220.1 MarR family transcriptional regulator [Rhodospirillum rubrum]MBK1676928.1 MarR family transcriptional regulator [Rhodospirillum rubrum]
MAEPDAPDALHDRAARAATQWRTEWPDIDTFPMEVLGRLTEVAQIVTRDRLNPLFAAFGLQNGEFDVLATLRRSGEDYALTPTALYEAAMISSGGMTARIDRLEKAGLVERRKHPTDRRGTLVALTDQGKTLIDDVLPVHVENERTILATLSEPERRTLNALLAKLLGGLL